ncbi:MAG: hypothetical protein WBE17_11095 [Anaerolineae bacterium]
MTDFPEVSPHQVREKIAVDGKMLISHVNGRAMVHGQLETPTLGELRERVHASGYQSGKMSVREIVANVQQLHTEVANAGALFQVASQFNLLEMVSPDVTPERGVGIYDHDHTQGPACAIAAGAGTIYRNYFAMVNGQIGQSASNQIDCLADVGAALGNTAGRLWEMRNGYALASQRGLAEITHRLQASSERELDELRQLLRIGLQWNTQVTLDKAKHTVSQAYCSALPVTYSTHPAPLWAAFARLILEAAYEATICAGILNALSSGNKSVFLTLLGGGAFGNTTEWIMSAIQRALNLNRYADLDVAIVSYGASNPQVQQLLHQWS